MDPVLARRAWVNHSLSLSAVDMNSSSSTQKGPSLPLSGGGQGAGHQLQNKTTGSRWGFTLETLTELRSTWAASAGWLFLQGSLRKEEKIGIPYALCLDASHPPGGVSCRGTGYLDYVHTSPVLDLLLQAVSVSLLISLWMDLEPHPLSF